MTVFDHLLPVWPDLTSDILHKLELLEHDILVHALSSNTDTGKTALWADTDLLKGLLSRLALTLGNDVGGLKDLVLHLGLVLHLWNLGADNTKNDVLVTWQEAEWLEATGPWVVVLEVEGVVVERLEEALGNGLVGTLGEVHGLGEVTTADVKTNVQTLWAVLEGHVVSLEVGVEHLVWVNAVLLQALQHVGGAKVGQSWVVELDALEASLVEGLEFLLVSLGEIAEELLVAAVDLLWIALALRKTQVEVWWWWHGELALCPLGLWDLSLEVFPVLEVWTLLVLNFASADGSHWVAQTSLLERLDRWCRKSVDVPWCILSVLFKTTELLEETREVDHAVVLAGAYWANTGLLLTRDNVLDGLVLGLFQLRVGDLARFVSGLGFLEVIRAKERANVLTVEWKSHDEFVYLLCNWYRER